MEELPTVCLISLISLWGDLPQTDQGLSGFMVIPQEMLWYAALLTNQPKASQKVDCGIPSWEHSLHNAAVNVLNSTPTTLHSRQSVSFSLRLREHFFGKVIDAAVTVLVNTVPFDQIYLFFPGQAIDMQTSSIKP